MSAAMAAAVAGASTSSTPFLSSHGQGPSSARRMHCQAAGRNLDGRGTPFGSLTDGLGRLTVGSRVSAFSGTTVRMARLNPDRGSGRRGMEVVAMAKREQQLAEIRQMSDDDICNTVVELKGELFILRCKQATRQEYDSSEFRKIRKRIARMLTVRRERELEKGIKVRESRKIDREWKKNIVYTAPSSLATLGQ